jgi:hypothetical protein
MVFGPGATVIASVSPSSSDKATAGGGRRGCDAECLLPIEAGVSANRLEWRDRRRLSARALQRELDSLPENDGARLLRDGLAEFRRALEDSGKRVSHLSDAQLSAGVAREARKLRAMGREGVTADLLRDARRRYADSLPSLDRA